MSVDRNPQEENDRFFTKHAVDYDTTYWRNDERNITDRYFRKPGSLLIAGVGRGRTVPHLTRHTITGIDVVPEMIDGARKYPGAFHVMDMAKLDFPDNTFDYVFSPFNSVSCTADVMKTIKELRRVLKPGGTLVFQVTNQRRPSTMFRRRHPAGKDGGSLYFFNMLDVFRIKPLFTRAHVYGRMQWAGSGGNWKDRVLKVLPFLDKALYFVCVK